MYNLQNSYKDNYTEVLPVFLYHNKDQLASISTEMDRSIKKAMKLISMHSITAKPKIEEDKELSDEQREFYNKNEYNKWVDDAYLLMGKAHFHKQEYDQAQETFNYVVANFPKDENAYEAKIWLARLAIEKKKIKEAEEILLALEEDVLFPKHLTDEKASTFASIALLKEDYQKAIHDLKVALETIHSKYYKQRYNFITAQLYQKINEPALASKYYQAVIKLDPPYEMTFNARINMALTYESGAGSRKEIEKQLQKMLRDDKNIDYQDQIYYAWGNLYFKSGNKKKAVEYYTKSTSLGKANTIQLAITYLKIADIYYEIPDYVPAQSYYDSAVGIIDVSYPNYSLIYAKSISLTNLVTHIQTVALEDSVQVLSKLPKPEIYALVDNIIVTIRKTEEEARLKEQEQREQAAMGTQQQYEITNTNNTSFYFYNPTAVNSGRQEFKRKWGPRKLEDNWRRKNKSTVAFEAVTADADEAEEEGEAAEDKPQKVADKYSREYYLMNIPFTDSALAESHTKIMNALFEMGNIYFNELKDFDKAADAYTKLITRYPDNEFELQAYYKLYSIGKIKEDINLVALYQQKIINEYPASNYAKVLGDPEYFKKIEQEEKKYNNLYASVYALFEQQQYSQVANLSKQAIIDYPEQALVPQFDYMLTVSEGLSKDTVSFISDLQKLLSKYPKSDITENAKILIDYLQNINPEAAKEQKIIQAKELYVLNMGDIHFVIISIPKSSNQNQMMFNITNFNIDNFGENDLKVMKSDFSQLALLSVTSFKDAAEAKIYYDKISDNAELWRDVNKQGSTIFIISRNNFELLKKENNLETYLLFFEQNFK